MWCICIVHSACTFILQTKVHQEENTFVIMYVKVSLQILFYLFQFLSLVGSLSESNYWSIKRIQTPRPPLL